MIGGTASDTIDTAADNDIVIGDSGHAQFNSDLDTLSDASHIGILRSIETITPESGDVDTINTLEGDDIVHGGQAGDLITASTTAVHDSDIVLGDNGQVTYEEDGSILQVTTTDAAIGGVDTIYTYSGIDIVIGGTARD